MTDFAQDLRHRCRNPKCRMKLKIPVANQHHAFCTSGCHSSFYFRRCLVCENEKPAGRSDRKFCRRPRCRSKYAGNRDLFDPFCANPVPTPVRSTDSSRSAHSTGLKSAHESDRPWRLAAGRVTAAQYHCTTVPDGPDCRWADGEWRRIEGRNRALWESKKRVRARGDQVGHVQSDWKPCLPSDHATLPDLSIPDFLERKP